MEDETIGIDDITQLKWGIFPVQGAGALKVNYKLPEPANVTLLLCDLSGKLIINHELGSQTAGDHNEVVFVGSEIQRNIYIAMLRIDDKQFTRKIVF